MIKNLGIETTNISSTETNIKQKVERNDPTTILVVEAVQKKENNSRLYTIILICFILSSFGIILCYDIIRLYINPFDTNNQQSLSDVKGFKSSELVYSNHNLNQKNIKRSLITTGCINKSTPSSACCSGQIELDTTITSIGSFAFSYCSGLTGSLTIPTSVTSIGGGAFGYCSGFTGSLTIPTSVTSIGDGAFAYCSGFTGSLRIPISVISIGSYAFAYCSGFNGSLTIPTSVTSIGNSAFAYCSGFTGSLRIPISVISIGSYAFAYCSGFNGSLTIPTSVTSIGNNSFAYCTSLTYISYYGSTKVGFNAFIGDVTPVVISAKPSASPSSPTFAPSVSPTARPTTLKPTFKKGTPTPKPTLSPTNLPTVKPTTSRPTFEPSFSPTSYPTSQPSISILTILNDNLNDLIRNNSLPYGDSLTELSYSDILKTFKNIETFVSSYLYGGCLGWHRFIFGDLNILNIQLEAISINLILLIMKELNNKFYNSKMEKISCLEPIPSSKIINSLLSFSNVVDTFVIECSNHTWTINHCLTGSSLRIDCPSNIHLCNASNDNICNEMKSSLEPFYIIDPCNNIPLNCSFDTETTTSSSSINHFTVVFKEREQHPIIQNFTLSSYSSTSIVANLKLSSPGSIYCKAYEYDIIPDSITEVILANYINRTNNDSLVSVTINGLKPVTEYSVYCLTQSNSNVKMSYNDMLNSALKYSISQRWNENQLEQ